MKHFLSPFLVVCGLLATAGRGAADDAPKPDLKPLLAEVQKLVQKYYPTAEVTLKDQTIHFEFNVRKFMLHEPTLTGEWQDAYEDWGPQKGGIHADLELREGQYSGMAAVPQTIDKRYFTLFLTAPHSRKIDHHLYIHLKYPRNVPEVFVKEFVDLTNGFDKYVEVRK